jgi:hypothetical protein
MKKPTDFVKDSLFLVMHPFKEQPAIGVQQFPWIDNYNQMMMEKIIYYSSNIKHKAISCPFPVHSLFGNWINFIDRKVLIEYMKQNQLDSLVYAGFHHGACIVYDPTVGCRLMTNIFKCYLKHDLVCLFPVHDWEQSDRTSDIYMGFL